jgi:hypothetical protein
LVLQRYRQVVRYDRHVQNTGGLPQMWLL